MGWAEMNADQRTEVADWLVTTCQLMGASLGTSHLVAGEFVRGLDRECRPTVEPEGDRHGE